MTSDIREAAKAVNTGLMRLVSQEDDSQQPEAPAQAEVSGKWTGVNFISHQVVNNEREREREREKLIVESIRNNKSGAWFITVPVQVQCWLG